MNKYRILNLAAVLLAWMACAVLAADAPVVKEIRIRATGRVPVDESLVKVYVRMREGQAYDREQVARDVRSLLDTRRFADVDSEVDVLPEGVRLVYIVRGRMRLAQEPVLLGVTQFYTSTVKKWLKLVPGDMIDERVLGAQCQEVMMAYRKRCFPDARVNWKMDPVDGQPGLAKIVVTVIEGPRAKIRKVEFSGNRVIKDSELKETLHSPPWWNIFKLRERNRYDEGQLESARLEIRDKYMRQGYLDVAVGEPAIVRDRKGYRVAFDIHEGICYRFGSIDMQGIKIFPAAAVRGALPGKSGDVASKTSMENIEQAIRDYYGSRGYIESMARPTLTPDPAKGTVDVRYQVQEGHLTHIRNILISGNSKTRDKVIRREVLVSPGEIYNEVKIRRTEKVLQNLGYFETVRSEGLRTASGDERDLVFLVDEKPTGQFMVGAGFSSIDKLSGFAELSQGNFDLKGWPHLTGGGQKVKLTTQVGERRKEYGFSFVEPWFLDKRLALGVDLDRSEVDYTDYDLLRQGAGVSLTKGFSRFQRGTIGYRFESSEITDVADTNRYVYVDDPSRDYYFTQNRQNTKSGLRLAWAYDTRDNVIIPTRGTSSSVFLNLWGGPLGADVDYYDTGVTLTEHVPLWWHHVLTFRGKAEVIDSYGDTDEIPLEDRLFAGGGRTIRGFDYRDVGPKVVPADPDAPNAARYRPVGGQSLAYLKTEYSVPLVKGLRMVGFYDVGNVWQDPYEFDFSEYAAGAGIGLRVDLIPYFPIVIDRAWAVRKDDNLTDEDAWSFWIGREF